MIFPQQVILQLGSDMVFKMNNSMKKFFLLILAGIILSCSSYNKVAGTDHQMKKVSPGMSRKKVISIMGKNYEVIAAKNDTYILGYKASENGFYKLVFEDNKLKEWTKEWRKAYSTGRK